MKGPLKDIFEKIQKEKYSVIPSHIKGINTIIKNNLSNFKNFKNFKNFNEFIEVLKNQDPKFEINFEKLREKLREKLQSEKLESEELKSKIFF